MTPEERSATLAFNDDLHEMFTRAVEVQAKALTVGDSEAAHEATEDIRRLYAEIREVEYALAANRLPF